MKKPMRYSSPPTKSTTRVIVLALAVPQSSSALYGLQLVPSSTTIREYVEVLVVALLAASSYLADCGGTKLNQTAFAMVEPQENGLLDNVWLKTPWGALVPTYAANGLPQVAPVPVTSHPIGVQIPPATAQSVVDVVGYSHAPGVPVQAPSAP